MAGLRLCRRCKDRLRQAIGIPQACRQRDSADLARLVVILQTGAGEKSARYAFDGKDLCFLHEHGPAFKLIAKRMHVRRVVVDVRRDDMVRNDVFEAIEPERRHLRQYLSFVGDRCGQNDVECRQTVRSDDEEVLPRS